MRKTLEDKKLTETSLLKSALTLFLEDGYSKVTIAQISEHSNLTRGAFYWHFTSKEEILNRILMFNRNKLRTFLDVQFALEFDDELIKTKTIFGFSVPANATAALNNKAVLNAGIRRLCLTSYSFV